MADFYATKKYSGRAGSFGDYSKVEGEFHSDSNDAELARGISKDGSYCVDYAMKTAKKMYQKEDDNND